MANIYAAGRFFRPREDRDDKYSTVVGWFFFLPKSGFGRGYWDLSETALKIQN
jgi:hypothetical protein